MVSTAEMELPASDRREAFHDLFLREAPNVTRFARNALGDDAAAQDVCAEAFCRAWNAWHRFRGDDAGARAWIFRIARNQVADHFKAARRRPQVELDDQHPAGHREIDEELHLRAALADLDRADREILGLRSAGLSHAEIGRAQGRSENAAKQACHRALQRLKTQLGEI